MYKNENKSYKMNFKKWKQFEIETTKYLNDNFSDIASFHLLGNSDTTKSDILVTKKNNYYFIEAKNCPAQCGQFVLLPNANSFKFSYSKKNSDKLNSEAQIIINHMDNEFNEYNSANTAGKLIEFYNDQLVFSSWIIEHYKSKKVRFIITNNNVVIKLEDFEKAFYIKALFRIKRSGSSNVGIKNIDSVKLYLEKQFKIKDFVLIGSKLFFKSDNKLENIKFNINENEYYISKKNINYEVRKLSRTFNSNVIFSIQLKPNFKGLSKEEIKKLL